jgi:dihydropyrimidine dehydrogenase (NAD+) subunit PreT
MDSTRAARLSSIPPRAEFRLRTLSGPALLFLCLTALVALLAWRGADFYRLDLESRIDHADFRRLSPGAPIGHGYGVFGTLLVLTNLLYLARRRFARWHLGSMRLWLNIHVFTGLFGSVLVLFHSAFQLRSAIASLTAFALALVVLSGVVGRYFYSLSPQKKSLQLTDPLETVQVFDAALAAQLAAAIRALPPAPEPARATLLSSLSTVPAWLSHTRARRATVRVLMRPLLHDRSLGRDELPYLRTAVRQLERAVTEPIRTAAGTSLLRTWRGLHRFMALLMIVSVTVHIAVAWVFGYRWIFE